MTAFRRLPPLAPLVALVLALSVPTAAGAVPAGADAAPATSTYPGALRPVTPKGMGMRYSLPESWSQEAENGHTQVHHGPRDTPEWYATVTVTNQKNPTPSLPSQGAAQLVSDYVAAIQAKGETQEILREAPFRYTNPGPGVDGTQAVTRFLGKEGLVRQWVVAVGRADIPVVHLVIYTAPDDLFDQALPAARVIVESLTVNPAKR
jgi:hypothetical protein